ncbi:MAG: hypothetical protein HOC20_04550 [Chloroflexi bacterium]|jgi:hypothetical protein|nr:hypothetical protein [Chloroflexota bacterium]
MPKRKKADKLNTEEIAKRLFPKKVVEEAQKVAHKKDSHKAKSSDD